MPLAATHAARANYRVEFRITTSRVTVLSIALSGLGSLVFVDPGAARFASLRVCPWLPYVAPSALVEYPRRWLRLRFAQ
ncbi:MAG: hypothetical protein H0T64_08065 [Pyrinomonadaceae bacterium]|nr:hypothetical protein [Pyrinomonadaceae bacterium]